MTFQGHPRSSILAPIEIAYWTFYRFSIVIWVISCPVSEILELSTPKATFSIPYPHTQAKISGCSLRNRFVMLGSAERRNPELISHQIIFEVFQPMWLTMISQRYRETDRQTNGRTTCHSNTAICVASRCKNVSWPMAKCRRLSTLITCFATFLSKEHVQ